MTPEEFNNLPLSERGELVFQQGKYLETSFEYTKQKRCIYHYCAMLVDVIYNKESNKIEEIKAWGLVAIKNNGRVVRGN